MKLELEIPDSIVCDAAIRAWKDSFASQDCGNRNSREGYELVCEEVRKFVRTPQMAEDIAKAVKHAVGMLMPQIARECVSEDLRRMVKRTIKEAREAETLFTIKKGDGQWRGAETVFTTKKGDGQ